MGAYHDTLGVPADADKAAIKKAYRKLAKECHPDSNMQEDEATRAAAQKKFVQIQEAYDGLNEGRSGPTTDPREYAKNHFGFDPMDIIREMARHGQVFSQMTERSANSKMNTIQKMRIPVKKLLQGGTTVIEYNTPNIDKGAVHFEHFTKEFVIPPGALVGSKMVYPGEGGRNEKGEPGDLIIQLFAGDDPPYEVHNEIDIVANIQLNPFDIMLGATKKIRHPDGVRIITFTIPPGGHPQNVYAEDGQGLAAINGQVGDLLLQGQFIMPVLNKKQREVLAKAVKQIHEMQVAEVEPDPDDEVEFET